MMVERINKDILWNEALDKIKYLTQILVTEAI